MEWLTLELHATCTDIALTVRWAACQCNLSGISKSTMHWTYINSVGITIIKGGVFAMFLACECSQFKLRLASKLILNSSVSLSLTLSSTNRFALSLSFSLTLSGNMSLTLHVEAQCQAEFQAKPAIKLESKLHFKLKFKLNVRTQHLACTAHTNKPSTLNRARTRLRVQFGIPAIGNGDS
jgi:hypothetical protein